MTGAALFRVVRLRERSRRRRFARFALLACVAAW
jgi:hypothetical protein